MAFKYKIVLKNDMGEFYVNYAVKTKSGKRLLLKIGDCFCSKGSCDCITEFSLPFSVIAEYELGTYAKPASVKLNVDYQYYKGIKLKQIRRDYQNEKARRFTLGGTNQNVWIPNKHLEVDGTIKENENIDYVFRKSPKQLEIAGYTGPIIGIKRANMFPSTRKNQIS